MAVVQVHSLAHGSYFVAGRGITVRTFCRVDGVGPDGTICADVINGRYPVKFNSQGLGLNAAYENHILSTEQPPADIVDDYEAAIDWYRERVR